MGLMATRSWYIPLLLFAGILGGGMPARAFTPTVTSKGVPVRWKGWIKLNLAGNPVNRSGLSEQDFFGAVVHSLERWQTASGGAITFDYWQGTDSSIFIPNSEFNGLSSIYFASNESGAVSGAGASRLTPNVLGLTQVWYDSDSGEIIETDMVLNDRDFHFTMNKTDTSGFGAGGPTSDRGQSDVYIENVLTHELGHVLGLSHAAGLQSTMLFMESPEQAHLSCDEQIAIHALYPTMDASERGSLSGKVVSEAGIPLFGAHVLAVSRRRGTVLATALTDRGGGFTIPALEPGTYFLLAEPFFAGPQPLPSFYSSMSQSSCPNQRQFIRTFLTEQTGLGLQPVVVSAGASSTAPVITVQCDIGAGEAAVVSRRTGSLATSPVIYDGATGASGFGAVNRSVTSGITYYRLSSLSGHVEIHVLSYSLYSPVRPTIALLGASGAPVPSVQVFDRSYTGDSGYVNWDAYLIADQLPTGDYYLQVATFPMSASYYPAGGLALDPTAFVLVTGSVGEPEPPLAGSLADNARCRAEEKFTSYTSPPGNPPRRASASGSGGGALFCGSLEVKRGGNPGPGPDAGAGAVLGWFLPWVFMLVFLKIASWLSRSRDQRSRAVLAPDRQCVYS